MLCASLSEVFPNDSSRYFIADKSFLAKSLCAFISSSVLERSEISDFAFSSSANRSLSVVETMVLIYRFIILKTKAALNSLHGQMQGRTPLFSCFLPDRRVKQIYYFIFIGRLKLAFLVDGFATDIPTAFDAGGVKYALSADTAGLGLNPVA